MKVYEDFKFRDDLLEKETDTVPIEILEGPYKGVVYRYTQVQINEGEENATVKFAYDILSSKVAFKEEELRKDKIFTRTIGLILNNLVLESVESETMETEELDKLTENPMVDKDEL